MVYRPTAALAMGSNNVIEFHGSFPAILRFAGAMYMCLADGLPKHLRMIALLVMLQAEEEGVLGEFEEGCRRRSRNSTTGDDCGAVVIWDTCLLQAVLLAIVFTFSFHLIFPYQLTADLGVRKLFLTGTSLIHYLVT